MSYALKCIALTTVTVMAMIAAVRCLCHEYCPTVVETTSPPWEQQEPVGWVFGRVIGVSPSIVPRPGQAQPWSGPSTQRTGGPAVLPPRS